MRKIVNGLIQVIKELVARELADPETEIKSFDPVNYGAGC